MLNSLAKYWLCAFGAYPNLNRKMDGWIVIGNLRLRVAKASPSVGLGAIGVLTIKGGAQERRWFQVVPLLLDRFTCFPRGREVRVNFGLSGHDRAQSLLHCPVSHTSPAQSLQRIAISAFSFVLSLIV